MNNEILRYKNKPNNKNEVVSFTSINDKKSKNSKLKQSNSLWAFLKEEEIKEDKKVLLEESAPIEKPKLGDAVNLFTHLLIVDVLLVYLCTILNNIFFVFVLAILASITIPISMIYFFCKLNTRTKLDTLTTFKLLTLGGFIYLILGSVLDRALITNVNYNYMVSSIKSGIEFLSVFVIVWLIVKRLKIKDLLSVMCVATIISGGYAMARCIVELMEVVFVRVQITNNGVVSAVGAIINNSESVKISVKALINNLLYIAVYKSALFMSIMVIGGFALRQLMFKNDNDLTPLTLWLVITFSVIVNAFSLLTPSIMFLRVLYMLFSILITSYVLLKIIDYSIKMENYK